MHTFWSYHFMNLNNCYPNDQFNKIEYQYVIDKLVLCLSCKIKIVKYSIKLASKYDINELSSPIIQLFSKLLYCLLNNLLSDFFEHVHVCRLIFIEIIYVTSETIDSMFYLL